MAFSALNAEAIILDANQSLSSKIFEQGFINYYEAQGKKSGTYIKKGKIWTTGTPADFDKLVADEKAEYLEYLAALKAAQKAAEDRIAAVNTAVEEAQQRKLSLITNFGQNMSAIEAFFASTKGKLNKNDFETFKTMCRAYISARDTVNNERWWSREINERVQRMNSIIGQFRDKMSRAQKKEFDSENPNWKDNGGRIIR